MEKSKKKAEEVVEKKEEPVEKEEEVEQPEETKEENDDSRSGLSGRSLYNENLLDSTLSDENVQILAQEKVKFNQKKKRRAPDIPRLAVEVQQGESLPLHVPDDQLDPQKPYAERSKVDDKRTQDADSTIYYSAADDQSIHGAGGGSSRSQFSPLTIDTNQQNSQSWGGLRPLFFHQLAVI